MASHMSYESALVPRVASGTRTFHDVWEPNFEEQFEALLYAVTRAGGRDAILAMDMEFPGFPCKDPQFSPPAVHHQALRCNVDQLWPVQLGVAVMSANGMHHGVWTFNLRFDPDIDAHTEESMVFLRNAGLDMARHRTDGIAALALGCKLAHSSLLGLHGHAPSWLTFSGAYDWAYLLKLVTLGQPLPSLASTYEKSLAVHCPKRQELRDLLPDGSLEALGRRYAVKRCGVAHTAGSDALLTAELFFMFGGTTLHPHVHNKLEHIQLPRQWSETTSESSWQNEECWQNEEEWFSHRCDDWYAGASETSPLDWVNASWVPWGQRSTTWHSPNIEHSNEVWYASDFQPWVTAR